MPQFSHLIKFALALSVAVALAHPMLANAQALPAQIAPAVNVGVGSGLPPIFTPGNHLIIVSRTYTGPLYVREVLGEWIFANVPGQNNPVWLRPASMDASWALNP